jgi:hypothetical protein
MHRVLWCDDSSQRGWTRASVDVRRTGQSVTQRTMWTSSSVGSESLRLAAPSVRRYRVKLTVVLENHTADRKNDPYGNRTRVAAVKGQCPRPLDEGVVDISPSASAKYTPFDEPVKTYDQRSTTRSRETSRARRGQQFCRAGPSSNLPIKFDSTQRGGPPGGRRWACDEQSCHVIYCQVVSFTFLKFSIDIQGGLRLL